MCKQCKHIRFVILCIGIMVISSVSICFADDVTWEEIVKFNEENHKIYEELQKEKAAGNVVSITDWSELDNYEDVGGENIDGEPIYIGDIADRGDLNYFDEDEFEDDNEEAKANNVNEKAGIQQGANLKAVDNFLAKRSSDGDPKGSKVAPLKLKSAKQTSKAIGLSFSKVKGAKKYEIYGNLCSKKNKMQKLATTTKAKFNVKKIKSAKLKKDKYYKFLVIAIDANDKVVATSKYIHVATKGGKVGNHKSVKTAAKNNKVTLKTGKSFKLQGKAIPKSKKLKVKKHRVVIYESSNAKVAAVSKKGVIKAKAKGTCQVYAYAQNGVMKTIKVTVK